MAPNRTKLQSLTQKIDESFKYYAQRWRDLASRVEPPLLERELTNMFMSTLQGPYLDMMVRRASSGFLDLVVVGEQIENCLKNGKIQGAAVVFNEAKKPYYKFTKKKEGEANASTVAKGKAGFY